MSKVTKYTENDSHSVKDQEEISFIGALLFFIFSATNGWILFCSIPISFYAYLLFKISISSISFIFYTGLIVWVITLGMTGFLHFGGETFLYPEGGAKSFTINRFAHGLVLGFLPVMIYVNILNVFLIVFIFGSVTTNG